MSIEASASAVDHQMVFNIRESAEFLRVSEKTVHRKIKDRKITVSRIGKRIVIQRVDLIRFLNEAKVPGENQNQCRNKAPRVRRTSHAR